MPITVDEKGNSRQRSTTSATIEWVIKNATADTADTDALNALLSTAPATWGSLLIATVNVEERDAKTGLYHGVTTYSEPNPGGENIPAVGVVEYNDTTSMSQVKVTHSLQTVNKYPPTAIDFKQGINPKKNGGFEGVDIPVPTSEFSYTFRPITPIFDDAYVRSLEAAIGHVNSASWRNRPAGEVQIKGKQFSADSTGKQQLTVSFIRRANVSGATIGTITGIAKDGHDYLWVHSEEKEDESGYVVSNAIGAYVERMFPRSNFTTVLGF